MPKGFVVIKVEDLIRRNGALSSSARARITVSDGVPQGPDWLLPNAINIMAKTWETIGCF